MLVGEDMPTDEGFTTFADVSVASGDVTSDAVPAVTVGNGLAKGYSSGTGTWGILNTTDPYAAQTGTVAYGDSVTVLCQRTGTPYRGNNIYDYVDLGGSQKGWLLDNVTPDTPYNSFDPGLTQACPPGV